VRFNGIERDDVEEYSVSEGWIRVQAGKSAKAGSGCRPARPATAAATR